MISSVDVVPSHEAAPAAPDTVEAELFAIFRKYLKIDGQDFSSETTMEEAQVDSLDLVEVIFEIEDRFGVEINFNANDKPAEQTTFGDVVALIRSALAAKAQKA